MKSFLLLVCFLLSNFIFAKVEVLFHPYDPSLSLIAEHLGQAKQTIDIAMYNMDTTEQSPIISLLSSDFMQSKIRSGELQVRLIFQGYEDPEKLSDKKTAMENLGVDVRHLAIGAKMHHKFAVIDGFTNVPTLVTGSANWSLSSRDNYNENILLIENKPGLAHKFQEQFQFLWDHSKDYGSDFNFKSLPLLNSEIENGFKVFFNTDNFVFVGNNRYFKSNENEFVLTKQVVRAIDAAKGSIKVASTRIKLRPIYNALVRAAQRGVKIEIVVTMEQYEFQDVRSRKKIYSCQNEYNKKCSTSKNFSIFLSRKDFQGSENIDLRVKYFNINKAAHLSKQMHSKYIIIDDQIITGSFNWSYSSEYNHIENIVKIDGIQYPDVLEKFEIDFKRLWDLNRDTYSDLVSYFERAAVEDKKVDCAFDPITLNFSEIDYLLNSGQRFNKSLIGVCK